MRVEPKAIGRGVLGEEAGRGYVSTQGEPDSRIATDVWDRYLLHWLGQPVQVYELAQRDYRTDAPIVLLCPDEGEGSEPFVSLYYNERLTGYIASTFGHLAINVCGRVFNFSHLLNEDEEMTVAEFFYRPALGEFAPHPGTGGFNVEEPEQPYYDKFGRRFMRTIHELRIEGLDTAALAETLREELATIHATPVDPELPHKYRDFNFCRRSCVTVLRDALRLAGLPQIRGILPRELYLNVVYHATRADSGLMVRERQLPQLKVPERDYSAPSPILNPLNRVRHARRSRAEIDPAQR